MRSRVILSFSALKRECLPLHRALRAAEERAKWMSPNAAKPFRDISSALMNSPSVRLEPGIINFCRLIIVRNEPGIFHGNFNSSFFVQSTFDRVLFFPTFERFDERGTSTMSSTFFLFFLTRSREREGGKGGMKSRARAPSRNPRFFKQT